MLATKPDLIVSEFVNDAGLSPAQVNERYGKLRADFQRIGAEWIILTPHYVRPDWMGLNRERDVDDDPRPYVAGLRQFAAGNKVALADASRRYGRLWRQGHSLQHAHAQLHQPSRRPRHEAVRRCADGIVSHRPAFGSSWSKGVTQRRGRRIAARFSLGRASINPTRSPATAASWDGNLRCA